MRKVLPVIVVCAMLIGMFAVAPVKHVYAVVPGFDSSIQVQNLSSTAIAHITLDYYLPDGTVDTSASDTIDPSSSKTYMPIHPDAGFNGSVVISSDIPIATISNLTVTATNRALGTYDGVGGGGSSCISRWSINATMCLSLPVQNVGTVDASPSQSILFPQPGSAYVEIADVPDTIEPGASHTFDMADYNGTT